MEASWRRSPVSFSRESHGLVCPSVASGSRSLCLALGLIFYRLPRAETMASCFQHLARRTAAPAAACLLSASASTSLTNYGNTSNCEAPPPKAQDAEAPTGSPTPVTPPTTTTAARVSKGVSVQHFQAYHSRSPPFPNSGQVGIDTESTDNTELYHGLFPTRQLFHPSTEYPLWNYNWDGKRPAPSGDAAADKKRDRHIRKTGVTRHVILVRHGKLLICFDS